MSHSVNHQFVHLLWATKNLAPLINEDLRASLLAYLTGIVKGLGGILLATSGTSDHVHLLVNSPPNLSLAEFLRDLKSCSSKWCHEKGPPHTAFGWNAGYSAFTVSPTSINDVKNYLVSEEHRHTKQSFEDELKKILSIQEIEYKPQFLTNTTYTKLIFHLVWSVKNRLSFLSDSLKEPLHQYIEKEIAKDGCKLYAIGNVSDHIHLLFECSSKISMANLVQNLKTKTTHLIKSQERKFAGFCRQEGYGVFSVGRPALETVLNYVNNQEKHHNVKTFEEEWNWLRGMQS